MKDLSRITETFTESVIREMTRISDSMGGLNLSQGFPDFDAPNAIKKAAIKAINDQYNQYPVTFGEPELRAAICQKAKWFNGLDYNPATDVTVTCGATEAMIATMKAIINPGDEIIIFEPFYENYGPDGILSGATPRYVKLHPPDWTFDEDELKAAFNARTKAIIINTPNNPTGKVFTLHELKIIAELCMKWDVYAVTDEIYEHIVYENVAHVSLASVEGMHDRTITINSLSKSYSVTGWRVGWAIAAAPITARIRKVHDFMTVGAPTPFQHAGVAALNFTNDYYVELRAKYLKARNFLYDQLLNAGFNPYKPYGAYYIIADASQHVNALQASNDMELSVALLKRTRVATVPGFSFYSAKNNFTRTIRFAFCKREETLEQVVDLLKKL